LNPTRVAIVALSGAALVAGCDQGTQKNQETALGGTVAIVDSNLGSGTLAQNGTVRLRFNRYLLPSTVTRQAVVLLDASDQPVSSPLVTYDPVTLSVSLSNPTPAMPWLTPGQPYKVVLPLPGESATGTSLRAIDGAGLDPASMRTVSFTATSETEAPGEPAAPAMNFCTDVYPVFVAKCGTGSACHSDPAGTQNPASSLVLLSPEGVQNTAVRRVAQAANTGGRAALGGEPGRVFGVDMPLIAPGNPGNSWLLYKVLLAPLPQTNVGTAGSLRCRTKANVLADPAPVTGLEVVASDAERASLADAVLGREMPYPPSPGPLSYATTALSYAERQRLRLWIAQGAVVEACGACE